MKLGIHEKRTSKIIIGFIAAAFQILALYYSGWQFVWLSLILYAVGFILYTLSKKEYRQKLSLKEISAIIILTILGVLAIVGVYVNWLGLKDTLGVDGNTLLVAVIPLVVVTLIVYLIVHSDIKLSKEVQKW